VLITGAVEGDPYGRIGGSLKALGIVDPGRPVAQHERTSWADGWATFDGQLSERLRRSTRQEPTRREGPVWHEPLPLEFARESEPLAELLGAALNAAALPTHPSATPVVARLLRGPRAILAVCVNETSTDAKRRLTVEGHAYEIPVPSGRTRFVLFQRGTAKVLASSPGQPVLPANGR
jgi:hypothetical protein